MQTSTERDLGGIKARAEREQRAARRDQVDELAEELGTDGVVTQKITGERAITQPIDIPDIGDQVLERWKSDPAFRALWNRVDKIRVDERRQRTDTADRITEAMGKRPPNERLTSVETRVKIIWVILAAIGSAALGSAITVAKGLYGRGETDGQHEIRLQQVERFAERIEHDFIEFRRRFEPAYQLKGTP